ncbi:Gfo/Idh/MocA family protein, partial [Microbacterium sp. AGC62]
MTTAPLKIGVLGLGWMGTIRAEILNQLPGAQLVACGDANPGARERVPAGVTFVSSIDEIISAGADAVVVSTPDGLHREATVRALKAGVDVFCEKPLATSLEDADAMIAAEEASTARIIVGQTLRADPRYRALKVKVESGELGATLHATSRRSWPAPEGARQAKQTTVARYLSVHELDALQWILDQPIVSVYGRASGTRLDGFGDTAASIVATLEFADGSVATHECTWGLPDKAGLALGDCAMSVIGTEGAIYMHEREQGVVMFGGASVEQPTSTGDDLFSVRGAVEFPATDTGLLGLLATPYAAELAAFIDSCRLGSEALVTAREARQALAAVIALEESLATGLPVSVSALTE